MTETQQLWVREVRKGNELAAYNLYRDYSKAMYNTLLRMVDDAEIAKDLLQECFVKAFQNIHQLSEERAFGGWLKRIVINAALEYGRKKKWIYEDIGDYGETLESAEEIIPEVSMDIINSAIRNLPMGCRAVFTLYMLENYRHAQIAEELGITESTSKTQLRHAKKLLRQKLSAEYEGYGTMD